MNDQPLIDWQRVCELRSEIGADGFTEVVGLFLEEVDAVLARLQPPVPARLEDEMHFLKGSAWNLGFAAFASLAQAGERAAMRGDGAEVDIAAIAACYARSRKSFLDGLAGLKVA